MIWIKVVVFIVLVSIIYQDLKDREVSWFLFPLLALPTSYLHYENISFVQFGMNVLINALMVSLVLLILYLYIKIRNTHTFFNAFGLGDLVMFYALCFSFASVSFVISFVFSILFSLVLSIVVNKKSVKIPLAGYMALFFLFTFIAYWIGLIENLYLI